MLPVAVRAVARNLQKTSVWALSTTAVKQQGAATEKPKKPTIWKFNEQKRERLANFGRYTAECHPKFVQQVQFAAGDDLELPIHPTGVVLVLSFLNGNHSAQFTNLTFICGIDVTTRKNRFEVVYSLYSVASNARIRVRTYTNEIAAIESATSVFKGADWFEREVYDMYGVCFNKHPDLRRILIDYGFEGHPFRKDFPLSGYNENLLSNLKLTRELFRVCTGKSYRNRYHWKELGTHY